MLISEALKIIENGLNKGYMVTFEHKDGCMLRSDYFPDKHAGEPLIETEAEAWHMASKFAQATRGKCVNVYVIRSDFTPVSSYKHRMIENRG